MECKKSLEEKKKKATRPVAIIPSFSSLYKNNN